MTKTLKQTKQLTGFPGNPNARTFFTFSGGPVVISANVSGFPGLILICIKQESNIIKKRMIKLTVYKSSRGEGSNKQKSYTLSIK